MTILSSIGNTSLVRLQRLAPARAGIFAKLEWEILTSSMKGRMASAVPSPSRLGLSFSGMKSVSSFTKRDR